MIGKSLFGLVIGGKDHDPQGVGSQGLKQASWAIQSNSLLSFGLFLPWFLGPFYVILRSSHDDCYS
uniref:Uncharacterized protein n=1 Tax=Cucumis melo TaxID=3656 RepID=A0A9I9E7Y5_CUCME